jgi:hypothetical protein
MNKYLAALLCMFAIAACAMGGAKQSARAPSTMESGAPPQSMQTAPDRASPKEELDYLFAQVEQQRVAMQLGEPQIEPGSQATPMTTPMPTSKTDPTCKKAASETCQTSCTLSDSICENTDKICKLAADLQPDDDASTKCAKATKTCKSSHEKCCSCML